MAKNLAEAEQLGLFATRSGNRGCSMEVMIATLDELLKRLKSQQSDRFITDQVMFRQTNYK